jgi:hypothetical protein
MSLYPYIDAKPEHGGWGFYRYLSPFEKHTLGWSDCEKSEVRAKVMQLRSEYAEREKATRDRNCPGHTAQSLNKGETR